MKELLKFDRAGLDINLLALREAANDFAEAGHHRVAGKIFEALAIAIKIKPAADTQPELPLQVAPTAPVVKREKAA
jgi:hypothetical protein